MARSERLREAVCPREKRVAKASVDRMMHLHLALPRPTSSLNHSDNVVYPLIQPLAYNSEPNAHLELFFDGRLPTTDLRTPAAFDLSMPV
eukprot:COSAG02_NODE_8315_length_2619_cov_67.017063_2_plen_90_part_00